MAACLIESFLVAVDNWGREAAFTSTGSFASTVKRRCKTHNMPVESSNELSKESSKDDSMCAIGRAESVAGDLHARVEMLERIVVLMASVSKLAITLDENGRPIIL